MSSRIEQSAGSAASRGANENEGGSRYVIQHLTRHKCVFRHQHHRPTKALAHFGHFALCNKFLLSLASLIHLVISMYYLLQRAIRLESMTYCKYEIVILLIASLPRGKERLICLYKSGTITDGV